MKFLSDKALERLRDGADTPDLAGIALPLAGARARGGMGVVSPRRRETASGAWR